jgi:hypothetical protein
MMSLLVNVVINHIMKGFILVMKKANMWSLFHHGVDITNVISVIKYICQNKATNLRSDNMYTILIKQEGYPITRMFANTKRELQDILYFNGELMDKVEWSEDKQTVTITKLNN